MVRWAMEMWPSGRTRAVFGDKESCAFIVTSKTQEELAGTIVPQEDRLALEHLAAEGVPRVLRDVQRAKGAVVGQ